ncbi:MAG: hypothetical protein DRR08_26595 [Candidatus Parabeggiatoa sp. nov. 2]|nr:MAG: hypothetical protein B6247_26790 [Beggiatoa sp. 4572_84]RKZ54302.1 MAG: hypothetical protein DRR08_26595 [Gammaproteobacteria bacterium]
MVIAKHFYRSHAGIPMKHIFFIVVPFKAKERLPPCYAKRIMIKLFAYIVRVQRIWGINGFFIGIFECPW